MSENKQLTTKELFEKWFSIKGYEGAYEVSSFGRVRSLQRLVKHSKGGFQVVKERILKPCKVKGYNTVLLSFKGKRKRFYVHDLVCSSYLRKSKGLVVDHIDQNPLNNNVWNLRYVTQRENLNNKVNKSKTGYVGVALNPQSNKYRSRIRINGIMKNLGSYETALEASNIYQNYKNKLNGKSNSNH